MTGIMRKRLLGVLVVGVGLIGLAGNALAGTSDPIIENAGFERGDIAWRYWGDGDVREEYHGVTPEEGTFFLRIWSRTGWYQDFSVKPGEIFDVTAFATTASKDGLWGDAFSEVKIEWRNEDKEKGSDDEVGEATSIKLDLDGRQDKKLIGDKWTEIKLAGVTAPKHATHGRVLLTIWCSDEDGGGCALFDDIMVKKQN